MTSPDGALLPDPGSGWEGLGIDGLGDFLVESMVVRPMAKILSILTGRPPEEFDTQAELEAEANEVVSGIFGWLDTIPILGDLDEIAAAIRAAVTGATLPGGNPWTDLFSDLLGLFNSTETAAALADLADNRAGDALDDVADLVDAIANDTGATLAEAQARLAAFLTPGSSTITTITSDLAGKASAADLALKAATADVNAALAAKASTADLALKAAAADVQALVDYGWQGAANSMGVGTGKTLAELRSALNLVFSKAESATAAATTAQNTLSAFLAQNNATGSGGISASATFVGSNGSALSSVDWTTYLGNTTPSSQFLVIKNNNAAITAGTTDGTYRPHAMLKTQFTQDNQSVAAVLAQSGSGLIYSNETYLMLRANAAGTVFTYAKLFGTDGSTPRQISIGYGTRSGTTWTFNDQATITAPFSGPGALVEFRVAGNLYEILINNNVQLQWTDASSVTSRGASYRYAGFAMTWSRALFVNYFGPELSQFSISDYTTSGFTGMAFRLYRTNTAAVTFGNLSGVGIKSPAGFYGVQQNSANVTVVDAGAGVIKIPQTGWWTFEITYLMGAAVATANVVYSALYTGLTDPPLNLAAKSTGGAGTGGAIDQHIGGTIGPIYLAKDTYVAPGMWAIDTTSRSAKGGSLQNDCSFAGYLKTGL